MSKTMWEKTVNEEYHSKLWLSDKGYWNGILESSVTQFWINIIGECVQDNFLLGAAGEQRADHVICKF